jgi:hypothetical protein
LPWLEKYGIAERTARLCMQIFEGSDAVLEKKREYNKAYRKTERSQNGTTRTESAPAESKKAPAQMSDPIQEECDTEEQRWQRRFETRRRDSVPRIVSPGWQGLECRQHDKMPRVRKSNRPKIDALRSVRCSK